MNKYHNQVKLSITFLEHKLHVLMGVKLFHPYLLGPKQME